MKKIKLALMIGVGLIGLCFLWCFMLSWYYPSEFGAPNWVIRWQNEARASRFRKAAERGDAEAQRELGGCYFSGMGVPRDEKEAVKWYHKAADQGDADAHCRLAYCYYKGRGVPEDKAETVRLYRIAAEKGNIEGQWKLGVIYLNGIEVPKDETEAVKWFRKAAEQDYYHAKYLLGRCYFEGTGVPKDDNLATEWLWDIRWEDKAAEILKEIQSDNPRPPNPNWGEELRL
jgi:FOG: TPR repeat, SEL1 subfamily